MNGGTEWLVDAIGCREERLRDPELLRRLCAQVLADLDLRIVGQALWHAFPAPGGVTGLYLLTESHLACHTYPESGLATLNLYCCRRRPEWPWADQLTRWLGAEAVTVHRLERGHSAAAEPSLVVPRSCPPEDEAGTPRRRSNP